MKIVVQRIVLAIVITATCNAMSRSYTLHRRPRVPARLAPIEGHVAPVVLPKNEVDVASPVSSDAVFQRHNSLAPLIESPAEAVNDVSALPAGRASFRSDRGLVVPPTPATVEHDAAAELSARLSTPAALFPQKSKWSLTAISQVLLKNKAEFLYLDLANPQERAWILEQINKPDAEKKWFRKNNLPDITQRAAKGIAKAVFSFEQQQFLLHTYVKNVKKECKRPADWLDNGHYDGKPHAFSERVYTRPLTQSMPYIEKVFVKPSDTLICMGDLHGSLHSLLRNLWHMVECDQLKDDFTLAPNHHLIVLGNMADYGTYGVEVILLLLMLKLRNWDCVHLVRGNHEWLTNEGKLLAHKHGLFAELGFKYPEHVAALVKSYNTFCFSLPHALFVGVGDSRSSWWMQFSHGGVDPFVSVGKFLGYGPDAAAHKSKRFAWLASLKKNQQSMPDQQWPIGSGFISSAVSGIAEKSTFALLKNHWDYADHGYGICASVQDINDYLTRNNLSCLFRGDKQQPDFSFKLLVAGHDKPQTWRLHPAFEGYTPERLMREGFKPAELYPRDGSRSTPCFTCTTAGEGRFQFSDGYVIVHCGATYADTRVCVYENHLSLPRQRETQQETFSIPNKTTAFDLTPNRFGRFMTLKSRAGHYGDPYRFVDVADETSMHQWVQVQARQPIDSELIARAKNPFLPQPLSPVSDADSTITEVTASVEASTADASTVSVYAATPLEPEAGDYAADGDNQTITPSSDGPFTAIMDDTE